MRKLASALVAALASVAVAAHAQTLSPAARQVIAQARAASGGESWNRLRGWRETGLRNGQRYELWVDPVRYGFRMETKEPGGVRTHGFNGAGDWEIAPTGTITTASDRPTLSQARSNAYVAAHGFFFPSRFAADGAYVGVRQEGGRSFDVIRIEPAAGKPRELWFDRRTHLLGRVVDRSGPKPAITDLSDYRRIGAIMVAFRVTIEDGEPGRRQVGQVESVSFAAPDRSLFSLPRAMPAAPVAAPAPAPPQAEAKPARRRWPAGTLFDRR